MLHQETPLECMVSEAVAGREGTCLAGGCQGGSRTPEWQTMLAHHDVGARVMGGMELDRQAPRRND